MVVSISGGSGEGGRGVARKTYAHERGTAGGVVSKHARIKGEDGGT